MTSMKKSDRKRANGETHDDDEDSAGLSSSPPPPPYGSQEYWDERYKRTKTGGPHPAEAEPDPFHSWYFTYEELAPLILPLILGEGTECEHRHAEAAKVQDIDRDDTTGDNDRNNQETNLTSLVGDDVEKSEEKITSCVENNEHKGSVEGEKGSDELVDDEEITEKEYEVYKDYGNEDVDDDDDDPPQRIGLANDGPIEILEIGCGDVPLGPDIVKSILDLEQADRNLVAANILKQVVCIDYSPSVIEALKEKLKMKEKGCGSIFLLYECTDARNLLHEDGRFQLILEKGTMDAMLSDVKVGIENCRAIVGEMGRVLSIGGCIMIISHINAHTEKGTDWLTNVVIPGLRKSSAWNKWNIEVHGNDVAETEEDDSSDGLGPMVYILHKGQVAEKKEGDDTNDYPTVAVRFFSY